jgi:hypothetical protein
MVTTWKNFVVLIVALSSFEVWSEEVKLSIFALAATNEGRAVQYIDPSLNKIRHAVELLEFDTFKKVTITETTLTYDKETRLRINDRCTLVLNPVKKDSNGRVRIHAKIEVTSKDGKQKKIALDSYATMAPGKPFNLMVKNSDNDALIVVLVTA